MAKVKRMMFGGAALGAVKKAVTSKAAPMKMQAAAKSAAQQAAPKQFMSNALRSGAMKPPSGMNAAPKQFMSDKLRGVGAATTGVARGMMKKGGAVKKATKK